MEHKKSDTWRALVGSIVSMLLCLALLVGTTFAWFSESVTSEPTKVTGGNLEIKLSRRTADGGYTPGNENDTLFDSSALWEPGYTQVVYLKIENTGNLALKYRFAVNVVAETVGTNVKGQAFKLSDYLKFGVNSGDTETIYAGREDAQAAIGDGLTLGTYTKEERLLPASADYIAIVIYMPATVGNEINYKTGVTPPDIELEATLVATQETEEQDTYDRNYDSEANLPVMSAPELQTNLTSGGVITLGRDITVIADGTGSEDEHQIIPQLEITGKTASLNLDGRTLYFDPRITGDRTDYLPALLEIGSGATLTISGNGTITGYAGSDYNDSIGLYVNGGTLIIDSGTYYGNAHAIEAFSGHVQINGGFFDVSPELKQADPSYPYFGPWLIYMPNGSTATMEITGGTFVNYNPRKYVPSGYTVNQETNSGDTWYTVEPVSN
jgi:predicted ribosomally synthesized peptide with SipW-like signal peptide